MISDKFMIDHSTLEKNLDRVENMASCYGFAGKELLQIRLLAEETISVISPTLELSEAWIKMSTDDNSFSFTVDCDAGNDALDEKTKATLMKIGGASEQKGVFGLIGKIFDFLTVPGADYSAVADHSLISSYALGGQGLYGYYFAPELIDVLPEEKKDDVKSDAPDDKTANMEINIVEGFADDIQVKLLSHRGDRRLAITVKKDFSKGQIEGIEIA